MLNYARIMMLHQVLLWLEYFNTRLLLLAINCVAYPWNLLPCNLAHTNLKGPCLTSVKFYKSYWSKTVHTAILGSDCLYLTVRLLIDQVHPTLVRLLVYANILILLHF